MYISLKLRILGSEDESILSFLSGSINHIHNKINEMVRDRFLANKKLLSPFEIHARMKGWCKDYPLHSTSIQEIANTFCTSLKVANKQTAKYNKKAKIKRSFKYKLSWRSAKKGTLGWIPFKVSAVTVDFKNNIVKYSHKDIITRKRVYEEFKFSNSDYKYQNFTIKTGSFVEDSQGRWYLCLTIEIKEKIQHQYKNRSVGIDPGISVKLATSEGQVFKRDSFTKEYEKRIAAAQRNDKQKVVRKLFYKLANKRKDYNHKLTTYLAKKYDKIYFGNLCSSEILTENSEINKNIYDSSLYQIKTFLQYKTRRFGGKFYLVDESYSTQTCSACLARTGPKGKKDLGVKSWRCNCGANHQRDINAAKNIYRVGRDTGKPQKVSESQMRSRETLETEFLPLMEEELIRPHLRYSEKRFSGIPVL